MYWHNTSNRLILIDNEEGLSGSIEVKPGEYVEGTSKLASYAEFSLVRSVIGAPYGNIASATPMIFTTGKNMIVDAIVPTAADITANPLLVALTSYTAWGKIYYSDGASNLVCNFTVTGNGQHGVGAVFTFDPMVGAAMAPVATSGMLLSAINAGTGELTIQWSPTAPATEAKFELMFDYRGISESASSGIYNWFLTPCTSSRMYYVLAADIGADYAAGSTGQLKIHRVFATGSTVGAPCKETVYLYRDALSPTKPTHERTYMTVVVAADLF